MNKKMMVGIGILAVLIGSVFVFSMKGSRGEEAMEKSEITQVDAMDKDDGDKMLNKEDDKMMQSESSKYVDYSKVALEDSKRNRRVLFFYASWCPTCLPTDANLRANLSKIPADLTVIRVNYNDPDTDDEEKELAKKYGITYQHTFVQIDGDGKEITKWNGGIIDELLANIK